MNTNEFIGSCGNVEVRLFLIHEERVWDPDVFDELRSDGEGLHSGFLLEGQSGVGPELTKVEVQGEVLLKMKNMISDRRKFKGGTE